MDSLWPWLAIAGLGALHGLSPSSGWMFAAAWGLRERDGASAWRALPPIAIGHGASIAVVAFVLARGVAMDRGLFQLIAGALLVGAALHCLRRGAGSRSVGDPAGQAGMALWSFFMASAQGAGLMLLPALAPMCIAGGAARGLAPSGSLAPALSAVILHMTAMLLTTGLVASGMCRSLALCPGLRRATVLRRAWPPALIAAGVLLMVSR